MGTFSAASVAIVVGALVAFDPGSVLGVSMVLFWGGVFLWLFAKIAFVRLLKGNLRMMVVGGLLFRIPIVLAHLAIGYWVFGGQVDFFGYFGNASRAAEDMLRGDFWVFALPEDRDIGGWLVTVMLVPIYTVFGPSLFATFLWSGVVGFLGAFLFFRAFETEFSSVRDLRFFGLCLFFYPSLVFWTSLLGKDSWMFFFLGLTTFALSHTLRRVRLRYVLLLVIGVGFILVIRPPIGAMLAFSIVLASIVAAQRQLARLTGAAAVLRPALFLAVCGFVVAGAYLGAAGPLRRYGVLESESVAGGFLELAVDRHVGGSTDPEGGGSRLEVAIVEPTVAGAIRFLPGALLTFLFRPHIFEAHNAVAMMAAVDGALLILTVIWRWKNLVASVGSVLQQPLLLFSLVAFLLFSVGLSFETNLGAIVRHRAMVLPFLFLLIAAPRTSARETESPEAPGPEAPSRTVSAETRSGS